MTRSIGIKRGASVSESSPPEKRLRLTETIAGLLEHVESQFRHRQQEKERLFHAWEADGTS
jgi:hypothetical protein